MVCDMALFARSRDAATLDLVEESGRNIQRATLLLRDMLRDWPEHADLARDLFLCEQEGDRITHDLIHRLNGGGTGRQPFDTNDGHGLATMLDDIVDFAEQTADTLTVYRIPAALEEGT